MDVNFVRFTFIFAALFTGFVGLLLYYMEPYLPVLITRTYRYGKYSINTHQPIVAKVEVPKRYFKHFYLIAAPTSTYTLYWICYKYLGDGNIPETIYWILDMCIGASRRPLVSPESTILASTLICIHCWKRLYETLCISVFSNKNINISHYIIGHVHYIGTLLCVIGESKGFVKEADSEETALKKITLLQLTCAVIFLLSSYAQLKANIILRNLRKNKNGVIVSNEYKIPHGGLFKYVSGALQITEILIYVTMSIILWQSSTYHYVTVWVIINQVESAVSTHRWYLQTFKNYPKTRKVLIPYLF